MEKQTILFEVKVTSNNVIISTDRYDELIAKERAVEERKVYAERIHFDSFTYINYRYTEDFNLKIDEVKSEYIERFKEANESCQKLSDKIFKIHNMNILYLIKWWLGSKIF